MPTQRRASILIPSLLLPVATLADSPTSACASSATLDPKLPAITLELAGCDPLAGPSSTHRSDLDELSGLTAVNDSRLWVVSNNRSRLYAVDDGGTIGKGNAIDLGENGVDLEGVVEVDATLYAIEERKRTVVEVSDLAAETPSIRVVNIEEKACASPDQAELCSYLRDPAPNSGFEGIAFSGEIFYIVTEKNPGVLITLDRRLEILDHVVLNCGTYEGFCPSDHPFPDTVDRSTLDFSGLSWDVASGLLWIASDEAGAVFLYDPATRKHNAYPLVVSRSNACRSVPRKGSQCIEQPEGVAALGDVLRVVADRSDTANSIVYEYTITRRDRVSRSLKAQATELPPAN